MCVAKYILGVAIAASPGFAQATFAVTGTPIPSGLLRQNFGRIPKGIGAADLNICNITATKQSVVSSEIYQALAKSQPQLQPLGRDLVLASILRSQAHSPAAITKITLNLVGGVFSVLGSSKNLLPGKWSGEIAITALLAQQLLSALNPIMAPDQIQKFDQMVLESALVLDAGSCAERTVFTAQPNPRSQARPFIFEVR